MPSRIEFYVRLANIARFANNDHLAAGYLMLARFASAEITATEQAMFAMLQQEEA